MKIRIREENHSFTLLLPTWLVFSQFSLWLINGVARRHAPNDMANIPPEALEAIWAEMCRIKKKYGGWDLVEVESSDGEYVKITL